MVAKGEDGKPSQVPKLILENDEEIKRFIESMRMKEIKAKVQGCHGWRPVFIGCENATEILRNERCVVKRKLLDGRTYQVTKLNKWNTYRHCSFLLIGLCPDVFELKGEAGLPNSSEIDSDSIVQRDQTRGYRWWNHYWRPVCFYKTCTCPRSWGNSGAKALIACQGVLISREKQWRRHWYVLNETMKTRA